MHESDISKLNILSHWNGELKIAFTYQVMRHMMSHRHCQIWKWLIIPISDQLIL